MRQSGRGSGAFLDEAIRTFILIVALQAGKEPAVAWFDPALCPDVAAALTTRLADLGSLAWLRVDGDASATEPVAAAAAAAPPSSWAMLPAPAARMLEAGGVVLTSSRDAVEVYGSIWKNGDAARKAFQRADMGVGFAPVGLCRVDYLRAGRGQQPASAWFDPALDPSDVKTFLVGLGPLVRWEVANELQPDLEPPAMPASPALPEPEPAYVSSVQRDGVPALRPEVSAYVAPDGHTVLAKCPFCDMPHHHGGFGPRHAHCANPAGRIYILCDAGPAPASILALPTEINNVS